MKKLLLALLVVALMSVPAFASVQNIKISGSIDSQYLYRFNYDLGAVDATEDQSQSVFTSAVTVQVDADLSDNVAATVQLMNERVWDAPSANDGTAGSADETTINVNLAYVTIREMLYSPLTVVVGRQNFPIGNKLYFDGGVNGSTASDFATKIGGLDSNMDSTDAIRFILDYSPLTLQAFYAVVSETNDQLSSTEANSRLYGLIATYELGDQMQSLVEGVYLSKKDKSSAADTKLNHIQLLGIRGVTHPMENMELSLEYAHQGGTYALANNNKKRDAHAVQFIAQYQLPVLEEYKLAVAYSYTKLTGDHNTDSSGVATTNDDVYHQWDPLYEGQSSGRITNNLFTDTDTVTHGVIIQGSPMEDVISKLSVYKLYKQTSNQYTTGGGNYFPLLQPGTTLGVAAAQGNLGEKNIGLEIDLDTTYDYTEDVQFLLSLAIFKPGKVFKYRDAAKQVLAGVKVSF